MNGSKIITLVTDFGENSSYVAQMKGVLLLLHPCVRIVDVSHGVAPQSVAEAAFLLGSFYRFYAPGTVHLVVVDPGVGTARAGLAVRAGQWFFVAPDNGVLSYVLQRERSPQVVELTNTRVWRDEVASTFHGRDIFAPVAAHLARGLPLSDLGGTLPRNPVMLPPLQARRTAPRAIAGTITHIDRFGNLVSSIARADLAPIAAVPESLRINLRGVTVRGLQRTYADRPQGELIALVSSFDLLELAEVGGSAASTLGARVGDEITVESQDS